jgi:hypothetical protein
MPFSSSLRLWKNLKEYQPYRFLTKRPYVENLSALNTSKAQNFLAKNLGHSLKNCSESNPIRRKLTLFEEVFPGGENRAYSSLVQSEIDLATEWIYHKHAGRAIFDFSADLANAMAFTDVLDVGIDELTLPYESVYFHFGPMGGIYPRGDQDGTDRVLEIAKQVKRRYEEGLNVGLTDQEMIEEIKGLQEEYQEKDFPFEGGYVRRHKKGLTFLLVGRNQEFVELGPQDVERVNYLDYLDDYYFWDLMGDDNPSVEEAMDRDERTRHKEMAESYNVQSSPAALANLSDRKSHAMIALKLMVNGILYVNSVDTVDSPDTWPAGQFVRRTVQGVTVDEIDKKESYQVDKLGFRKIRFFGRHEKPEGQSTPSSYSDSDRTRTFMGRRGYWGWQAYGPGYTLRRRRWFLPIADPTGTKTITIYEVQ